MLESLGCNCHMSTYDSCSVFASAEKHVILEYNCRKRHATVVLEQVTIAAPLKLEYNCSISYFLNLINYCV